MKEVLLRPVRAALTAAAGVAVVACLAPAGAAAEPWGFEQVTPVNKGGGAPHPIGTYRPTSDGDALLYSATTAFEGLPAETSPLYARYLAVRGPDSWVNRNLDVSLGRVDNRLSSMSVVGASANLAYVAVVSTRALTPEATEGGGNIYLRNTRTGALTLVATGTDSYNLTYVFAGSLGALNMKFVGSDGRSAIFLSYVGLLPGDPDGGVIYGWTADDGLRALTVLPNGDVVNPGSGSGGRDTETGARDSGPHENALDHFYFSDAGGTRGVYVRSGDETRAVSWSRDGGSPETPVPAEVDAIADGGRFMLFHPTDSNVQLTADTPYDTAATGTRRLYRYEFATDEIVYIGDLSSNSSANAVGVHEMSQDGGTIAFQSRLALGSAPPSAAGKTNMYVWRDGVLHFVATADTGSNRLNNARFLRRLSESGRYLAFVDNSATLAAGFGVVDNVGPLCHRYTTSAPRLCTQVYLYDADADGGLGELTCVSCRPGSGAPLGDAGTPGFPTPSSIRMDGHHMRFVADDGTVFFTSVDDRLPQDNNGTKDVYASHDGELRLVSRGRQGTEARFLDATPDGKSVFFGTNDPIVPTDTDRADDVYMTRKGAGYPFTPPELEAPCLGSQCREPVAGIGDSPNAGSASLAGRGNLAGPRRSGKVFVAKTKPVRGAWARLRVRVPGKGRVRMSGPGLNRTSKSMARAGSVLVTVRLSRSARRALERERRVTVPVTVRFVPVQGTPSKARVKLTFLSNASNHKGR